MEFRKNKNALFMSSCKKPSVKISSLSDCMFWFKNAFEKHEKKPTNKKRFYSLIYQAMSRKEITVSNTKYRINAWDPIISAVYNCTNNMPQRFIEINKYKSDKLKFHLMNISLGFYHKQVH